MQWNAKGLMRKKTELEHRMNKDNIDICCIQETHLQKDKTFKVRGYQCFRTDRGGDSRKGGIVTLIKSNINAYMSSSSNDGEEQHTITVNTLKRDIILVNYYCINNINLALHNIYVRDSKITESDDVSTVMNTPLSYEELTSALSNLKLKKSPGPDAITNEMIVNIGQPALHKLLYIFNITWQEGTLPQIWREATMIPIHNKGKAKTEASSYRPISLTSCIVNVLERIINTRLKWLHI